MKRRAHEAKGRRQRAGAIERGRGGGHDAPRCRVPGGEGMSRVRRRLSRCMPPEGTLAPAAGFGYQYGGHEMSAFARC